MDCEVAYREVWIHVSVWPPLRLKHGKPLSLGMASSIVWFSVLEHRRNSQSDNRAQLSHEGGSSSMALPAPYTLAQCPKL